MTEKKEKDANLPIESELVEGELVVLENETHFDSLTDFLIETANKESDETEIVLSKRFLKGKKVNPDGTTEDDYFKFCITPMSSQQFDEYRKKSTFQRGNKTEMNNLKFNQLLIFNHCVVPNFRNANDVKRAGCATPEQFLNKVLLAGEIEDLTKHITRISGFNIDIDGLREEAKN